MRYFLIELHIFVVCLYSGNGYYIYTTNKNTFGSSDLYSEICNVRIIAFSKCLPQTKDEQITLLNIHLHVEVTKKRVTDLDILISPLGSNLCPKLLYQTYLRLELQSWKHTTHILQTIVSQVLTHGFLKL